MHHQARISNLRVYKKPSLNWWRKLIRWYCLTFRKQDYPVMMKIGWTKWPSHAVIVADVMNPTNSPGNIVRGPQFSLDWRDIETKECSDCSICIKPDEWSFIGAIIAEWGTIKFVRYCEKCKEERERTGELFSWISSDGGREMSHSVTVTMIADQEIEIKGRGVNIHDIKSIIVGNDGVIVDAYLEPENEETYIGWLSEENQQRSEAER